MVDYFPSGSKRTDTAAVNPFSSTGGSDVGCMRVAITSKQSPIELSARLIPGRTALSPDGTPTISPFAN